MMKLEQLPKIELHVHLDGSIRIETVAEWLQQDVSVIKKQMIADEHCQSLNDYLTKFELPIKMLQTKEQLTRVSTELACDLKKDGVIYAEIRFAPNQHTQCGLTLEEVLEAVLDGLQKVELKTKLILCMMRNASITENEKIITLAEQYLQKGVGGIDLAGAEAIYPTASFLGLLELARKKQIPYTIHAGEAAGVDSIQAALQAQTTRIGHGVRAIENKEILEQIKQKKVLLEICPTSNVQTRVIDDYHDHPIRKLYDYGCFIVINTDNRTVSNITLTEEYEKLACMFHFTEEEFCLMNQQAVEYAFLSEIEKQELIEMINQYILNKR